MQSLQTEITEVEKLMNDADLKDLKEKTSGVEAEIKRYEKNMANAQNDIEVIPGIEIGLWKDIKMPAFARSLTALSVISCPSNQTLPFVTVY